MQVAVADGDEPPTLVALKTGQATVPMVMEGVVQTTEDEPKLVPERVKMVPPLASAVLGLMAVTNGAVKENGGDDVDCKPVVAVTRTWKLAPTPAGTVHVMYVCDQAGSPHERI